MAKNKQYSYIRIHNENADKKLFSVFSTNFRTELTRCDS